MTTLSIERGGDGIDTIVHDDQGERRYPVPVFPQKGGPDFMDAPDVEQIAVELMDRHAVRFGWLTDFRLRFLWKAKGGNNKGHLTLGKCVKLQGLNRMLADGCDVVLWLAADHCAGHGMTYRQVEALVYHEMLHLSYEVTDDGDMKLVLAGHDAEVFYDELREYGAWRADLQPLIQVAEQLSFFGQEDGGE